LGKEDKTMAATQLLIQAVNKHNLTEDIRQLVKKKKESSKERRETKSSKKPENGISYKTFFERSDYKRQLLREELRFLHLTYNFIKGTPYKKVEPRVSEENRLLRCHCRNLFYLIEQYMPEVFAKEQVFNWVGRDDGK